MTNSAYQAMLDRQEAERELHNEIVSYYASGRLSLVEVIGQIEQTKHIMLAVSRPKED